MVILYCIFYFCFLLRLRFQCEISDFLFDDIIISKKQKNMLKSIAFIISNPKYDGLIEISGAFCIVHNLYVLLWNTIPKIAGKFIRKNEFIRQMRMFGFDAIQESKGGKENKSTLLENQKMIKFKIRNIECIQKLVKMQQLKKKKTEQKQRLQNTTRMIKEHLGNYNESTEKGGNIFKDMEILELVSKLKQINRNIFALNQEIRMVISDSFQFTPSFIPHLSTLQLLTNCFEAIPKIQKSLFSLQDLKANIKSI